MTDTLLYTKLQKIKLTKLKLISAVPSVFQLQSGGILRVRGDTNLADRRLHCITCTYLSHSMSLLFSSFYSQIHDNTSTNQSHTIHKSYKHFLIKNHAHPQSKTNESQSHFWNQRRNYRLDQPYCDQTSCPLDSLPLWLTLT